MLISCFSLCHLDPKPISLEESSLISLEHLAPKEVGTGKVFGLKAMLLHVLAQELSPIDSPLFQELFLCDLVTCLQGAWSFQMETEMTISIN